jgi:hypothetical protein
MTKSIAAFYSDAPFPHVLVYSTALVVLSLGAVGLISKLI